VVWPEVRIVGAQGWLTAAGVLVAVAAIVWLLAGRTHALIVNRLERRLRLAEDRERSFARIFHGRPPEEIAARLDALEARLASLPPRRLSADQLRRLAAIGPPPAEASYVGVEFDGGVAEARAYAKDFIDAFTAAPGWNVVSRRLAQIAPVGADVAIGLEDPERPSPTESLVLKALTDISLAPAIVKRTAPGMHVQLIVAAR
jgi:hypothetical protein